MVADVQCISGRQVRLDQCGALRDGLIGHLRDPPAAASVRGSAVQLLLFGPQPSTSSPFVDLLPAHICILQTTHAQLLESRGGRRADVVRRPIRPPWVDGPSSSSQDEVTAWVLLDVLRVDDVAVRHRDLRAREEPLAGSRRRAGPAGGAEAGLPDGRRRRGAGRVGPRLAVVPPVAVVPVIGRRFVISPGLCGDPAAQAGGREHCSRMAGGWPTAGAAGGAGEKHRDCEAGDEAVVDWVQGPR
mmetsp:Transcript_14981/g.52574  ORF Transcript_14981/g.52574 Transcript_14981/m.52574 type:complete len:244 (+) Transcript_14981:1261-1992(+)